MENAETILVVILASFLALFLLLGIILLIKCLKIANQVKRITDKAEGLVDQAESLGEFLKKASGTFTLGRLIARVVDTVLHREDTNKRKGRG